MEEFFKEVKLQQQLNKANKKRFSSYSEMMENWKGQGTGHTTVIQKIYKALELNSSSWWQRL